MVRNGLAAVVAAFLLGGVGLVLVAFAQQPQAVFTRAAGGPPGIGAPSPLAKLLAAETVIVGKVVAIEKDVVEANGTGSGTPSTMPRNFGGGGGFEPSGKVKYAIASVKIEDGLLGTKNVTHLKVGFVKGSGPELAAGEKYLLFLSKHPSEGFQIIPWGSPVVAAKDEKAFEKAADEVKRVSAVLKEPETALKAEKAADRAFAATVLVTKYRTPPPGARELGSEEVPEAESKLLLKALAEGEWAADKEASVFPAFRLLGLTDRDGWTPPKGATGGGTIWEAYKAAYAKWLDGQGKDYRVKKLVPKK